MLTKIGHFCENHVEKIVLVMAGVISVWLFFTRVIFSPNVVTLQGKNFTPGQIDQYVYEQKAQELSAEMQRQQDRKQRRSYTSRLTGAIDPCDPVIADVIERPLPKGFAGAVRVAAEFHRRDGGPEAPLRSATATLCRLRPASTGCP